MLNIVICAFLYDEYFSMSYAYSKEIYAMQYQIGSNKNEPVQSRR